MSPFINNPLAIVDLQTIFLFSCRKNTGEGSPYVTEDMSAAAQSAPLLAKVVRYSVAIANNAGKIIRDIMKKGELGIVEKEAGLYLLCNKTCVFIGLSFARQLYVFRVTVSKSLKVSCMLGSSI